MEETDMATVIEQAAERGKDAGLAKASWVFDGNTSQETYERFLEGFEDGDPEIMDSYAVSPLSGEWAGESIPELLGDLINEGEEDDIQDILDAYEQAFDEAYWAELERVARFHTT
jgi:hypothetical protein